MAERKTLLRLVAPLLAVALIGATRLASAEDASAILERIRDRGAVYLGYQEAALPFSYLDEQQHVRGYSWELCSRVVVAMKERLGLPVLRVVPVPMTDANLFMQVRTGAVDLGCSAAANNVTNQRLAAFSYAIYVGEVKVMVAGNSPIRRLADLEGRKVATVQGTDFERHVRMSPILRDATVNFITARNEADLMRLLERGKADAVVLDDTPIAVHRAAMQNPSAFRVLDESLFVEPYGIIFGRDDETFRGLVNDTLADLMRSGELRRIYDRWFMSPLPTTGLRLDLPMSELLRQMVSNPADQTI